jgi:hypothetical protein
MANGQITFQPSINTVQEFKADNSTYSAENGRNSGAVVHIATRSCTAGAQFALPSAGGVHFGNMRRNSVTGPDFKNLDFSITKVTKITERVSHEFRFEAFDIFNHPNFGNPGLTAQVGSTSFGVIRSTRFPTGDSGSARQLQFGMKLIF